jgi:hypothetical protein
VIASEVPQFIVTSPLAFFVGVGVGFVLSNRWKIIRRNGKEASE